MNSNLMVSERGLRLLQISIRLIGFIGIPIIFSLGLLSFFEKKQEEQFHGDRIRSMEGLLSRLTVISDPQKLFNSHLKNLTGLPFPGPAFSSALRRFYGANREALELIFFGRDGNPRDIPGLPPVSKFVANHFLQALLNPGIKTKTSLVTTFGGNVLAAKFMSEAPKKLIYINGSGRKTWGGWWPLADSRGNLSGYLIAFVHREGIKSDRLLDRAVMSANKIHGERVSVGWFDPVNPGEIRPGNSRWDPGILAGLGNIPVGQSAFEIQGKTCVVRYTPEGEVLFCVSQKPYSPSRFFAFQRLLTWCLGAIAALLLVAFSSIFEHSSPFFGSFTKLGLRTKLILLLVGGVGTPLALLTATAFIDSKNQEEILIDNFRRSHVDRLTKIDQGIHADFHKLAAFYKNTLGTNPDLSALRNWIRDRGGLVAQALTVDSNGKMGFYDDNYLEKSKAGDFSTREINRLYGVRTIQVYNEDTWDPPGKSGKNSEDELISHIPTEYLKNTVLGNLDEIRYFNFLGNVLPTYLKLVLDAKGMAKAVWFFFHDHSLAQTRYLVKVFESWKKTGSNGSRLFALAVVSIGRWPVFPNSSVGEIPALKKLADRAVISDLPEHQVAKIGKRDYLLTALRGRNLLGYVLILAQPLETIREQTRVLNRRLGIFSGAVLFLSLLFAWVGSSLILVPIDHLREGLDAVKEGDFSRAVRPGKISEMASVAGRFNVILHDLRELEVAKSVQEHLWPAKPLGGKDWYIEGKCVIASTLGGDHHDWFVLPDGRLLMAIGDVAGHGIPSALVEASAKVFLGLHAEKGMGPAEILGAMNRNFHEQVDSSYPMTFWIGIFDPVTRDLTFANGGHNFPLAFIGTNPPVFLEGKSFPLGIRKKSSYKNETVSLRDGAIIFLYSDGLTEARNPIGEVFSHTRLIETFERCRNMEPSAALRESLEVVHRWSGQPIPEDDQTLVVFHVSPFHSDVEVCAYRKLKLDNPVVMPR